RRLDAELFQPARDADDLVAVERADYLARGVETLARLEDEATRDERRRRLEIDIKDVVATLAPHREEVAEAFSHDEGGERAAPLDEGVRGERRAVDDLPDTARLHAGAVEQRAAPADDALREIAIGGEHLADLEPPRSFLEKREVREGAADIDAERPAA